MKKFSCAALLLSAAMLFSCGENKTDSNTTSTADTAVLVDNNANDNNMSANTDGKMGRDTAMSSSSKPITDKDVTTFVEDASSNGMMEVALGNYAAQNASSQRVRDFGSMLVTDHTKANNELRSMAMSNSITVLTTMKPADQEHVDMLMKKRGTSFDKEYITMMADGHKKTIDKFKNASSNLNEDSYKAFATMTLPVLQKHHDSAVAIRKGL